MDKIYKVTNFLLTGNYFTLFIKRSILNILFTVTLLITTTPHIFVYNVPTIFGYTSIFNFFIIFSIIMGVLDSFIVKLLKSPK